ncbi:MAG: hypothetical protein ACK56I_13370, partial [bacterium]
MGSCASAWPSVVNDSSSSRFNAPMSCRSLIARRTAYCLGGCSALDKNCSTTPTGAPAALSSPSSSLELESTSIPSPSM